MDTITDGRAWFRYPNTSEKTKCLVVGGAEDHGRLPYFVEYLPPGESLCFRTQPERLLTVYEHETPYSDGMFIQQDTISALCERVEEPRAEWKATRWLSTGLRPCSGDWTGKGAVN